MEELEGDFALNKHGWFTAQSVAENEFLNSKLESDKYGIWYSVKFTGDAETYLWQTKARPVEGEKYWGWLEKTKSGKATKFKWDKQNAPNPGSSSESPPERPSVPHNDDKEDSIARAVALKAAVELHAGTKVQDGQSILDTAEGFLKWLKHDSGALAVGEPTPPAATPNEEAFPPAVASGYQKFQEARAKAKQDPELQSLIEFAEGYNGGDDDHTN